MTKIAAVDRVDRAELVEFLRTRHRCMLSTRRADGSEQLSPVTAGVDQEGRVVISSYPQRAKVRNLRRHNATSACFLSDQWDGPWVQVYGTAEILDLPEALDAFVDYYRCIAGEHPDWDEYRQAMLKQGKSLIRVSIDRWGPVATGGFPPDAGQ